MEELEMLCKTLVTRERIGTILEKLVLEGKISKEWDAHTVSVLDNTLTNYVIKSCIETHRDELIVHKNFKKGLKIATRDVLNELKAEHGNVGVETNDLHCKYRSIERLKSKDLGLFNEGDAICIQEKIDGANASFQYIEEAGTIVAFSRKQVLSEQNDLRGFWHYVQSLDKDKVQEVLGTNLRMFGEWLVPHTVVYPEDVYEQFYCFDVLDMKSDCFLSQRQVRAIVHQLDLPTVHTFYEGPFMSWEHVQSFVGQTHLGGEIGEGVVLKTQEAGSEFHYTKLLGEKFSERKHKQNEYNPAKKIEKTLEEQALYNNIVESIVTDVRVKKLIHKLVDDGELCLPIERAVRSGLGNKLVGLVIKDCMKEESGEVARCDNFGGRVRRYLLELLTDEFYANLM